MLTGPTGTYNYTHLSFRFDKPEICDSKATLEDCPPNVEKTVIFLLINGHAQARKPGSHYRGFHKMSDA